MVVVHFYTNHIICTPEGKSTGNVFGIVPTTYRHFVCVGESTVRHVPIIWASTGVDLYSIHNTRIKMIQFTAHGHN